MIELELKYELKDNLKLNIKPTSEKVVDDIYYDTKNYDFLRKGNFLRIRNNKSLDFKLNANNLEHLYCKETNYKLKENNISEINEVIKGLNVNIKLDNISDINNKFIVLAQLKKKRYSYRLEDNIIMVIDEVENLGNFLEIEYDIDKDSITEEEKEYYKKYLEGVLKKYNILTDNMKYVSIGYVELYLKKYNMEAYNLGIYHED